VGRPLPGNDETDVIFDVAVRLEAFFFGCAIFCAVSDGVPAVCFLLNAAVAFFTALLVPVSRVAFAVRSTPCCSYRAVVSGLSLAMRSFRDVLTKTKLSCLFFTTGAVAGGGGGKLLCGLVEV
jgi:hypothetical protein